MDDQKTRRFFKVNTQQHNQLRKNLRKHVTGQLLSSIVFYEHFSPPALFNDYCSDRRTKNHKGRRPSKAKRPVKARCKYPPLLGIKGPHMGF